MVQMPKTNKRKRDNALSFWDMQDEMILRVLTLASTPRETTGFTTYEWLVVLCSVSKSFLAIVCNRPNWYFNIFHPADIQRKHKAHRALAVRFKLNYYDQWPLPDLPSSVTSVEFCGTFNHPFTASPHLKTIECGVFFNSSVDLSKAGGLTKLSFGNKYSKKLASLPRTLKVLRLGQDFDSELPELPKTMRVLGLSTFFNKPLPTLPAGLKELRLGQDFDKKLPELPETLELLHLSTFFNQPLPTLPAGLKDLRLGEKFNQKLPKLPAGLEILEVMYQELGTSLEQFSQGQLVLRVPETYNGELLLQYEKYCTVEFTDADLYGQW